MKSLYQDARLCILNALSISFSLFHRLIGFAYLSVVRKKYVAVKKWKISMSKREIKCVQPNFALFTAHSDDAIYFPLYIMHFLI